MRRFSLALVSIFAALLTVSCTKPSSDNNSEAVAPFSILTGDLVFDCAGGTKEFEFTAPQTGGSDDYVHDNILRKILSADIFGEDLGALEAGASASVDFLAGALSGGNFHAVVYVTEGGIVISASAVTLP